MDRSGRALSPDGIGDRDQPADPPRAIAPLLGDQRIATVLRLLGVVFREALLERPALGRDRSGDPRFVGLDAQARRIEIGVTPREKV
jgi:hypothetical protein